MHRVAIPALLLAAIVILASVGGMVRRYTDWLWFSEVGFAAVFATMLKSQVALELIFTLGFFLVLYTEPPAALKPP